MYDLSRYLVLDVETNSLQFPSEIHVICTRDQDGKQREFRHPLRDSLVYEELKEHVESYRTIVGHNLVQYDYTQVFERLLPDIVLHRDGLLDTLVVSRLINYSRPGGHSIRSWGEELGVTKEGQGIEQWDHLTEDMVLRCHSDCEISHLILKRFFRFLSDARWEKALDLEHKTALTCGQMSINGFPFDKQKALQLRDQLQQLLDPIDAALREAFPPRPKLVREITPVLTQAGTLHMKDFRWMLGGDMRPYSAGAPFSLIEYEEFSAGSPKQIVQRLNEAGWKPTEKTKGHTDLLKKQRSMDKAAFAEKKKYYEEFGWAVSEENLRTLPDTAPEGVKKLGQRMILSSRLSDLDEWLGLVTEDEDGPIVYGNFNPIGAWTHRLSHSRPNLANVPVAKRSPKDTEFQAFVNDTNDAMRGLWTVRKGHRLIGTDADGLQMRVFAHIVNDKDLIYALVSGSKEEGTDIHTLHKGKLGEAAKSRDAAKTFIYAWLLGAGTAKVAQILETNLGGAKEAVGNFIASYPMLKELKETQIPKDAARGYFEGLDGRLVICSSEHLMLAGYLQNGEAIIMKGAAEEWQRELDKLGIWYKLRTWPHDEWQTEIEDDDRIARIVADVQINSIRNQAVRLGLNCPLEGTTSEHNGFIGGYNWAETH